MPIWAEHFEIWTWKSPMHEKKHHILEEYWKKILKLPLWTACAPSPLHKPPNPQRSAFFFIYSRRSDPLFTIGSGSGFFRENPDPGLLPSDPNPCILVEELTGCSREVDNLLPPVRGPYFPQMSPSHINKHFSRGACWSWSPSRWLTLSCSPLSPSSPAYLSGKRTIKED